MRGLEFSEFWNIFGTDVLRTLAQVEWYPEIQHLKQTKNKRGHPTVVGTARGPGEAGEWGGPCPVIGARKALGLNSAG